MLYKQGLNTPGSAGAKQYCNKLKYSSLMPWLLLPLAAGHVQVSTTALSLN